MATKQNGVLGTFTPTVTPYTNDLQAANSLSVTPQGWPLYTCPGATMMSGKVIIANNTGGAATVDVGIVEQTDIIQLDAAASQPGAPTNYLGFSIPDNNFTTSIVVEGASVSGTFQVGETVTWTNARTDIGGNSQSAICYAWDSGNSKLWLRNLNHPLAHVPDNADITFTGGTSNATISVGISHAGTGTTAGWSGKVRFFDRLNGRIYLMNHEFRNNLDYKNIMDINNENRVLDNNNIARTGHNLYRPVATTVTRYAASNTTPATEFVDNNGVELLISGVSEVAAHQLIVNQKSIADDDYLELGGIVLGTYQSLYIKSTAAVSATLIGFEETAEVPS